LSEQKETTMEQTARGRTTGALRCMNCYERLVPPPAAKTLKCPHCSYEWRIYWISPEFPRIRGPVWEVNKQITENALQKKQR
jgi:hypothetical protein